MFPPSSNDTKIAVLEERLSVYEQMMERIDTAIQKIGETSQNISQMLAVHNEKIEQCNRTDNLIVSMIEDIKKTSKEQHEEISRELGERIDNVEEKVEHIGKIKWMVIGMGTFAAIIVATISQLAGGILNPLGNSYPQQIQQERLAK
jgi:CII-binding regulator of phage lambda lysogenization HflD